MAKGIEGLDRLKARYARLPEKVKKAAAKEVVAQADRLAGRMRQVVPVDQGDLKDSIAVTTAGNRTPSYSHPGGSHVVPEGAAEVTAGNNAVRYAHLVEYGTRHSNADPFFWSTVRTNRKRVTRAISKAVRDELRRP